MLQLLTERLHLRELREDDWRLFLRLSSDPAVRSRQSFLPEDSESECRAWVRDLIFHNCQRPRFAYNFAMLLEPTEEEIGWIGFGHASDKQKGDREFGYAALPRHWGQGYMTEALREVLSFAFSQRDVDTIFGECSRANAASARVMQKCGMSLDSRWIEHDKGAVDQEMERYLIGRSEWKDLNEPPLGWD